MTAQEVRKRVNEQFPDRCECGGRMGYDVQFGRVFSWCVRCTPVVNVSLTRLRAGIRVEHDEQTSENMVGKLPVSGDTETRD